MKKRRLYEGFGVLDLAQKEVAENKTTPKETISSDIITISTDTVSNSIKTISSDIKTISTDTVISSDTVSDTVSKNKKEKPSLLELFVLKELSKRLENGISTFQTAKIAKSVGTTLGGARNSLNRLKSKGLIENVGFQKGNNVGFTSYKMNPKCFEFLNLLREPKETISNDTVLSDTVSDTVSQYSKKEELNLLTEELKSIGIKHEHLTAFSGSKEDLEQLIENFSYSIKMNEIKVSQKMSLFLSLLRDKKAWVSQSLILAKEKELIEQDKRIAELKRLKQQELTKKFEIYKLENPNFLSTVQKENKFTTSEEVLNQIAFSRWQEQENEL